MRKKIAVFASGNGSNLQAIIDYMAKKDIGADIDMVFSDNIRSMALKRAGNHGIKTFCKSPKESANRQEYDKGIVMILKEQKIDLVVLAGYMLILGREIIKEYPNRIINIHPAILPCFKGMHSIRDAYSKGVKVTGVTVHFVDEDMDNGPIIAQVPVFVDQSDTLDSLEEKIHSVEHKLYPRVVEQYCAGLIKVKGSKVFIKDSQI